MAESKRLYVLRHAKSSWDDPGMDDHERPLAPRGKHAVKAIAEHLRKAGVDPTLVLCSTARRTRETLEGLDPAGKRLIEPSLYGASVDALLERLRRVPEETSSVMVIGHNPTLQMLVLRLAAPGADGSAEHLASVQRKFPTGALATLAFDGEWSQLAPGGATLRGFVRPKQLG